MLKTIFPVLDHLSSYQKGDGKRDLIAAIMVASLLIPQSMAYAMLAGLPPVYGFYTAIVPLLIYGLFGTSRKLSVGPVAVVSIMIFAGLADVAPVGSALYLQLVFLTTFLVGIIQIILAIFRTGSLIRFVPSAVIHGFTIALALTIILNQLENILNFSFNKQLPFFFALTDLVSRLHLVDFMSFFFSLFLVITLLVTKWSNVNVPVSLWVIIFSMLVTFLTGLSEKGLPVVGMIQSDLPRFSPPALLWGYLPIILPLAFMIAMISYMESIAMAKYLHRDEDGLLRPNQELFTLGLANIVGSCLFCLPIAGAFSRSAVNDQAGARTGLSSLITALVLLVVLLYFHSIFVFLPMAALAVIIIYASIRLINIDLLLGKKVNNPSYILFLVTLIASLILGLNEGFLLGFVIGLLFTIKNRSVAL